jgi:hypothetical protein
MPALPADLPGPLKHCHSNLRGQFALVLPAADHPQFTSGRLVSYRLLPRMDELAERWSSTSRLTAPADHQHDVSRGYFAIAAGAVAARSATARFRGSQDHVPEPLVRL